jgi:hypothetical protein
VAWKAVPEPIADIGNKPDHFFGALLVDAGLPHAALSEHFSQKQVAEIAASVIKMNLRTRLKLTQGAVAVAE